MPVLVSEAPIADRRFVAAELGPHGVIDQFGQVVCDLDIGPETKEYIARLASLVLLTSNPAIAEVRNGADAIVQRNAFLTVSLIPALLARCITDFDVGQRQIVSVE